MGAGLSFGRGSDRLECQARDDGSALGGDGGTGTSSGAAGRASASFARVLVAPSPWRGSSAVDGGLDA
jgi:hypothetical protein